MLQPSYSPTAWLYRIAGFIGVSVAMYFVPVLDWQALALLQAQLAAHAPVESPMFVAGTRVELPHVILVMPGADSSFTGAIVYALSLLLLVLNPSRLLVLAMTFAGLFTAFLVEYLKITVLVERYLADPQATESWSLQPGAIGLLILSWLPIAFLHAPTNKRRLLTTAVGAVPSSKPLGGRSPGRLASARRSVLGWFTRGRS
jgi:hypothetical protein